MARTDRSFVCLACRHRFWPVRRCPACQDTKWLVDLELEPDGVTRVLPADTGPARAVGGVGVAGLLGAGAAVGLGRIGVAEVLLLPTALALGGALLSWPSTTTSMRWSILTGPVARAHLPRKTFRGTVRRAGGVKLLRSPLRDAPCVAYRLSGVAGEMPIDDARGRPFDLECGDGERIRVDATIATIDLPMHQTDELAPLPGGRARFLTKRGVLAIAAARVTEAVLEIGARVVVVGLAREEAMASGYRETRSVRTLMDAPGAPLLIRPASETPRKNQESRDASA